ncbi:hypothetical protein ACOMHN_045191 [Nucella lapillus]
MSEIGFSYTQIRQAWFTTLTWAATDSNVQIAYFTVCGFNLLCHTSLYTPGPDFPMIGLATTSTQTTNTQTPTQKIRKS